MPLKILVFGNPLIKEDSIALRILPALQASFKDVIFKEFDAAENLESEGRHLIILDSVKGIKKAMLIDDLEKIELGKIYSMHDFDLSLTLKLLFKIGAIDSVCIIGIPSNYSQRKAIAEAGKIISTLLSGNE